MRLILNATAPEPPQRPLMLHHLSLGARDIERAARFYDAVLAPLGYVRVWSDLRPGEAGQAVGYGPPGSGDKLAIKQVQEATPRLAHLKLVEAVVEIVTATRRVWPLDLAGVVQII